MKTTIQNVGHKIQVLLENYKRNRVANLSFTEYVEQEENNDPNFFRWLFGIEFTNDFDSSLTDEQREEYREFKTEYVYDRDNGVSVSFTDDNRNFLKVEGATTMDEAVTMADDFLSAYDLCVVEGGKHYGDKTKSDEVVIFNVG